MLLPLLLMAAPVLAEPVTVIRLDVTQLRQEIDGFGASDAWSIDPAMRRWQEEDSVAAGERLAQMLFSTESGIGLSLCRFNIGAGSAGQGEASQIPDPFRRAGLLIGAPGGDIDPGQQAGQLAFLDLASRQGVSSIVAFANSPPVWATVNGIAHPGRHEDLDE